MINKKYILGVMVAAQILIPMNMIAQREQILHKGTVYRFKTAPVDPYDVLRGRYVALSVESKTEYKGNENIKRGQVVYAILNEDSEGYARISGVMLSKPRQGDYIKTKVRYKSRSALHLDLPFDRFYMNEYKAPEAEKLYRKHSIRDKRDAYILVRVFNGSAAIEDLYLGGKPILDYFNK